MFIQPTPGRIVWYFGGAENPGEQVPAGVPLAALVAFVHPNGLVNLAVFDSRGIAHSRVNVPLAQEGETFNGAHAQWMPYQIGQAKKYAEPAVEEPVKSEFDNPPAIDGEIVQTSIFPPGKVVLPKAKKS